MRSLSALQPVRILSRRKDCVAHYRVTNVGSPFQTPPDPPYEGGDSGWSPLNNSKAWRIRRLAGATARLHWRSLLSQTVKHFFPPLRKAGPRGSPRARRGFPVSEINAGAFGCGRRTGQALCGLFLPQRAQRSQRRETERSASCASKRISVRFCGSFCA